MTKTNFKKSAMTSF